MGRNLIKSCCAQTENIYGTQQSFHSMYDLVMNWSLPLTLKFTELMKEFLGETE
jgi:hypothetical protein